MPRKIFHYSEYKIENRYEYADVIRENSIKPKEKIISYYPIKMYFLLNSSQVFQIMSW